MQKKIRKNTSCRFLSTPKPSFKSTVLHNKLLMNIVNSSVYSFFFAYLKLLLFFVLFAEVQLSPVNKIYVISCFRFILILSNKNYLILLLQFLNFYFVFMNFGIIKYSLIYIICLQSFLEIKSLYKLWNCWFEKKRQFFYPSFCYKKVFNGLNIFSKKNPIVSVCLE